MTTVSRQQVNAVLAVYAIARGVIDEIKPSEGELSDSFDTVTFQKTIEALENKSKGVCNG